MPTEQDIQSHLQLLTGQGTTEQEMNMGVMVVDAYGNQETVEVSPDQMAALGVGMAHQYMAKNGPVQPKHIRRQRMMTKAQLEEQKMNEAQGYPSNLDEAAKVKQLEQNVASMQQGIQAILSHLSGGTNVPPRPTYSPPVQAPPPIPSYPVNAPPPSAPSYDPRPQVATIADPVQSPNDSADSTSPVRVVRLSNGKTIVRPVPPSPQTTPATTTPPGRNLSMGPTLEKMALVEEPESDPGEVDLWVEEPEVPEFKNDPKLEKLAFMVQEVSTFLRNRDPHLFFRRVLPRTVSRQVGFSCWPKPLQDRFNLHFKTLLTDPVFLKGQVATALSFEFGHGLSAQKIAELVALAAGFMAFSLAGAEVNQ